MKRLRGVSIRRIAIAVLITLPVFWWAWLLKDGIPFGDSWYHVWGSVSGPDGQPVRGALVWIGAADSSDHEATRVLTDSIGHFRYSEWTAPMEFPAAVRVDRQGFKPLIWFTPQTSALRLRCIEIVLEPIGAYRPSRVTRVDTSDDRARCRPRQLTVDPRCIPYGQPGIRLTGTLTRETFPGRPGYESLTKGDEPETGFYLHLASPICARPTEEPGWDAALAPQDTVTLVQLLLDSAGYTALRPHLNTRMSLEGQASAWVTGHHHARILLEVAKPVRVVEKDERHEF